MSDQILRGNEIRREGRHQRSLPHLRFLPKFCLEPSTSAGLRYGKFPSTLQKSSEGSSFGLGVGLLLKQPLNVRMERMHHCPRSHYLQ